MAKLAEQPRPGARPVARSTYTLSDQAEVYVVLAANDGNVNRTARDTGVPNATIRRWVSIWDTEGPPDTAEVEAAAGDFLAEADSLRMMGLKALKGKLELLVKEPGAVNVAQVTTMIGILTDKIDRASGIALGRVEHHLTLPSPEELRAALAGLTAGAIEQARAHQQDIVDAEFVEEEPLALNR
jgi:hypothetical protein